MLEILDGGFLTTIQDAGRVGWARFGVPPSGPLDTAAFRAANLLVGNAPGAAELEITLTGPTLRLRRSGLIAVCGAEFEIWVGNLRAPSWHSVFVRAGQRVQFGKRLWGARAYLAIAGGLALKPFLGSQATYLPGGFGGLEGRALQAGDDLPVGDASAYSAHPAAYAGRVWPERDRPAYTPHPILRVILGPQDDAFTEAALDTFLTSEYELTAESNRMGARLRGAPVIPKMAGIVSDGVVAGSVQLPPDGQPIVMLADHQTTGGYPKIATVARADLPLLAQCLPGDRVQFRRKDPE
ncbi:MAG: biotin-dependent carboxyltransferase family protein [Anaerolineae bacterium]|nr:biotin-dependent carboxyltransferase family protein [Anaerolineae bacterium]